jgi:glycerol uptake operon antiterminator
MLTQSIRSLRSLPTGHKTIPIIENRLQLGRVLEAPRITAILLRRCNLFDFRTMLEHAHKQQLAIYVNIDHIDGIAPDAAGLHYLAHHLHVTGVFSSNVKILAQAKNFGLETVQRIFAVDSTGLEMAFELADEQYIDLLDISPAPVIPYIMTQTHFPLPFIGTGFISTTQQVQTILRAGAIGVTVSRSELWA